MISQRTQMIFTTIMGDVTAANELLADIQSLNAVTSVQGFTNMVELDADDIPGGTNNMYFSNSLARAAISGQGPVSYNPLTGVISITSFPSSSQAGLAILVGGTVMVANTAVTANSKVFLTVSLPGGTQGFLSATTFVGVGFTINSSSGSDTSSVDWLVVG
jgi:hypothetical protein